MSKSAGKLVETRLESIGGTNFKPAQLASLPETHPKNLGKRLFPNKNILKKNKKRCSSTNKLFHEMSLLVFFQFAYRLTKIKKTIHDYLQASHLSFSHLSWLKMPKLVDEPQENSFSEAVGRGVLVGKHDLLSSTCRPWSFQHMECILI